MWAPQPRLIEDEYTITDAVVVGTLLNSLLRHGDRVTVACQAVSYTHLTLPTTPYV